MAASKKANLGKTNLEKTNRNKTSKANTGTNSGRTNTHKGNTDKSSLTNKNKTRANKQVRIKFKAKKTEQARQKEQKKRHAGQKKQKKFCSFREKNRNKNGISTLYRDFLWILVAVSILLMLSNFGAGGIIGSYISNLFFGLFGIVTYVFPVFLFFVTAFMISNSKNPRAYRKMVGFLLMFVTVCAFMQLLTDGYYEGTTLEEYYRISALSQSGGGVLGGAICNVTAKAFGVAGTYVILVASGIISVVLVTQQSMFELMKKSGTKMYAKVKLEQERWEKQKAAQETENSDELQLQQHKQGAKHSKIVDGITKMAALSKSALKKKEEEEKEPINFDDLHETEETEYIKNIEQEEKEGFTPQNAFPIHRAEEVALWDLEELTIPKKTEKKQQKDKEKEPEKKKLSSVKENQQIKVQQKEAPPAVYEFPPITLLKKGVGNGGDSDDHLRNTAKKFAGNSAHIWCKCNHYQYQLWTYSYALRGTAGAGGKSK